MNSYSISGNLQAIVWLFVKPRKLINTITSMSLTYGVIAFVVYLGLSELSWLLAWKAGDYQSMNLLPRLLPIADVDYPLFMLIAGPLIKLFGIFVFIGVFRAISMTDDLDAQANRSLINLYLLAGSVFGLVALLLETFLASLEMSLVIQAITSALYALVFVLTSIYLIVFVSRQINYSSRRAYYTVVPAMVISWMLPGILFQ
ncbi:MAG: hypothetical protein HUJ29_03535 [Gammaproteobacteria bacterium]|nr:hypothetical protein [Gammaproteobacteria bacterium]